MIFKKTAKFYCYALLAACLYVGQTFAQSPVDKQLDRFKKADQLTDWLYLRIDHSYNSPKESLPFLMESGQIMWRKPKTLEEMDAWLMLLINIGYNQLYAGNIIESIDFYEKAYSYWQENHLNIDISDYVLKPWANNYTRLGDYEKALFIQQKSLDFAIKNQDGEQIASVYNNMAISYRSLGNYPKALEQIRLGLKNTKPKDKVVVLLNNTLADIYKDNNELDLAAKIISANIHSQEKIKPDFDTAYWLLSSYVTAADVAMAQGNHTGALHLYQKGLMLNNLYYKGNRLREKAYIITQMGKIKLRQNQPSAALRHFDQNLSAFGLIDKNGGINKEKIFGDNRIVDVFYQKALAFELLGNKQEALKNIRYSLLAGDRIRFELADVKTKQRFQADSKQKAEQAIAVAFDLLEKTGSYKYAEVIIDIIEQTKARTLLDDIRRNQQQLTLQVKDTLFVYKQTLERAIAYNEKELLQTGDNVKSLHDNIAGLKFKLEAAEKKLRQKYPFVSAAAENDFAVDDPLKNLPLNTHLVAFFCGTESIYAVEISGQKIKHISRILNAGLIKKMIGDFVCTYYHHGPDAMMNAPKVFFETSNKIYSAILGKLNIRKGKQLIIVPDDVLGYLSFDGLVTDSTYSPAISSWPYLIKKVKLSYAFSIQTLNDQSQKRQVGKSQFTGLFITHQNSDKQFIPAVAEESESLERLVSGRFLKDETATAGQFFKAFEQSSVLHISTHAYLSGAQKEPTLAFNDDAVFLFELAARKHAPALVVLSACQTADGLMANGEGIISLSRGFAAIGTQATIAALWNVNDNAAAVITAESYRRMLDGHTPAASLHLAKLSWINGKRNGEQEYLPYYWDALIVMGYDQKVALNAAGAGWGAYSILIISILVTFLVLVLWRLKVVYLSK